jgi:pimeloyl-ACP methyl ester carboxylesterase/DNA-binding CsgD family transcriptional regulator
MSIAWTAIGSGPPLVVSMMYGHIEQALRTPPIWAVLEEAGRGRTIVLYDGLGSGLSDRGFADISIENSVGDLEAVADAAGADRFALLTAVGGTHAAIRYASRHPDRVERLVVLGGTVRSLASRAPSAKSRTKLESMLASMELWWDDPNPAYRNATDSLFFPSATPAELQALAEWQRRALSGGAAVAAFHAVIEADTSPDAPNVRCPTLIVHSREDRRTPFDEARLLAVLIPNARLRPVDGGNSWPIPSDPDFHSVCEAVRDFLAEDREDSRGASEFRRLTPRQREMLELIARGLDNAQISAHLGLSDKTVRNMVTPILEKLEVENRARAIVKAREAGFGTPGRAEH